MILKYLELGSEMDSGQTYVCQAQSQLKLCWTEISIIIDFTERYTAAPGE